VAEYAITIEDVQRAAKTIEGKVLRTPLVPAPRRAPREFPLAIQQSALLASRPRGVSMV